VLASCEAAGTPEVPDATHERTVAALTLAQRWLADTRLSHAVLAFVTCGAVAATDTEQVHDLAGAAVWGLVRTAQSEHPGRFLLVDLDPADRPGTGRTASSLLGCLPRGEHQVGLRAATILAPRLRRLPATGLTPPDGAPAWRLDPVARGTLEQLALVPHPDATGALGPDQIRVAVRAAGVNFRDVLNTLGMLPAPAARPLGVEGAGVVTEVGPGVSEPRPGDRVLGMIPAAFGPLAVTDRRAVAPIPAGWTFAEAAAVPAAFLTAHYALIEVARLRPGERVLIHAATGGVGTAAVRLAHHLGATVYGTASPAKWPALRALGLPAERIASSRDLTFESRFAAEGGVDVVVNCLTQRFVDASLRLLRPGGRFVELGVADVRQPEAVAAAYPGVRYRVIDLAEAGLDRIQAMLRDILRLLTSGAVRPAPTTVWPVQQARAALRQMSRAAHVGKSVFTVPAPLDADRTVLVTGGTGALGGLIARHLVHAHGARHLLLVGRRTDTEAARALRHELSAAGAKVGLAAVDVGDRDAVGSLLAGIPVDHPLGAVVHAAGTVDNGVLRSLTPAQVRPVLRAKVDGAWHLHALTRCLDLSAFILFSSVAGTLGAPGQANYAAANAFLDALARWRAAAGLPATSLAWGLWDAGMGGRMSRVDAARTARLGVAALTPANGLALFDAALGTGRTVVIPARLDPVPDRASAAPASGSLAPYQPEAAAPAAPGQTPADAAWAEAKRLAGIADAGTAAAVTELVRREVATVLAHPAPEALDVHKGLLELGFDSLTAVELRNRLSSLTGFRLSGTLVFDYPTIGSLAEHLCGRLDSHLDPVAPLLTGLDRLEAALTAMPDGDHRYDPVVARIRALARRWGDIRGPEPAGTADLDAASDEELFRVLDGELRTS
jgi:NADPH:quinone reductase-like Zn-dependent oxidoreductase/acyl carrier protein